MMYTIRQTVCSTELERWDASTLDQVKAQYRHEMMGEDPPPDLRVLTSSDATFTLVTSAGGDNTLVPARLTTVQAWETLQHGAIDINTHEAGWSLITSGNQAAWLLFLPIENAIAWIRENVSFPAEFQ